VPRLPGPIAHAAKSSSRVWSCGLQARTFNGVCASRGRARASFASHSRADRSRAPSTPARKSSGGAGSVSTTGSAVICSGRTPRASGRPTSAGQWGAARPARTTASPGRPGGTRCCWPGASASCAMKPTSQDLWSGLAGPAGPCSRSGTAPSATPGSTSTVGTEGPQARAVERRSQADEGLPGMAGKPGNGPRSLGDLVAFASAEISQSPLMGRSSQSTRSPGLPAWLKASTPARDRGAGVGLESARSRWWRLGRAGTAPRRYAHGSDAFTGHRVA
jgi:hypothetical protein